MKINRRLINIAVFSLVLAVGITYFVFDTVKKAAQPEPTESIAYFKYSMDKDTYIKDSDIVFRETPKSLIPNTAIRSNSEITGKRLVIKAETGDMVLDGKLIERGDVRADVAKLWTIGLDVTNISSFLGGNLKEGGEYTLLYKDGAGNISIISNVKIANMVDTTGKLITETGDGLIKTINISVREQGILLNIASKKSVGSFELVDAPEGYEVISNPENTEAVIEQDNTVDET